jgi:hypothetical protein
MMLVLVALFLLVGFGINALSLRLGVRCAKIPGSGWPRILAATGLIWALSASLVVLARSTRSSIPAARGRRGGRGAAAGKRERLPPPVHSDRVSRPLLPRNELIDRGHL